MNVILKTLIFLVGFPTLSWGQYKYHKFTYAGLEVGLKSEIYRVTDTGSELYANANFQRGMQGVFIEQELNRYLSVSSGLYFTKYGVDFRFRRDEGYNEFQSMQTLNIPFLFRFHIPLYYGIPEVRLSPKLGVNTVFNQTFRSYNVRGKIAPDLSDTYDAQINYATERVYILAQGGLSLDLMFAKGMVVSVGGNYAQGIVESARVDLEYRISREINQGTLRSRGSFYNALLGIKYPVSRLWRSSKRGK